MLDPEGDAGLPMITVDNTGKLQITYLRRKASSNPGISYSVEFSDAIVAWARNFDATETVTSLDATFERVTVTNSLPSHSKRFSRVKITAP